MKTSKPHVILSKYHGEDETMLEQKISPISSISNRKLSPFFYTSLNDVLDDNRLKNNISFANALGTKEYYGTIDNEIDFVNSLTLFLNSTNETQHQAYFLKELILTKLKRRDRLLDIGIGDGQLTKWIGQDFKELFLVDIDDKILEAFRKDWHKNNITLIQSAIETMSLEYQFYDFFLLSHVLYYVPMEHWGLVLFKIKNSLRRGGYAIITLSGDEADKNNLLQYFGSKSIDIPFLLNLCVEQFGVSHVSMFSSRDVIKAADINVMCHLVGFLLNDIKVKVHRRELEEYIIANFSKTDGSYVIQTEQKYIVLRK